MNLHSVHLFEVVFVMSSVATNSYGVLSGLYRKEEEEGGEGVFELVPVYHSPFVLTCLSA